MRAITATGTTEKCGKNKKATHAIIQTDIGAAEPTQLNNTKPIIHFANFQMVFWAQSVKVQCKF